MIKLQPKDMIALATIIGIIVLKFIGMNGELNIPMAVILGYYFGHRYVGVDAGK